MDEFSDSDDRYLQRTSLEEDSTDSSISAENYLCWAITVPECSLADHRLGQSACYHQAFVSARASYPSWLL
jgi:hypothetical protein